MRPKIIPSDNEVHHDGLNLGASIFAGYCQISCGRCDCCSTLAQVLGNSSLALLAAAADRAGLSPHLSQPGTMLTLLAPTDEALETAAQSLGGKLCLNTCFGQCVHVAMMAPCSLIKLAAESMQHDESTGMACQVMSRDSSATSAADWGMKRMHVKGSTWSICPGRPKHLQSY